MRWFLVSISLVALSLASPAQAETWLCSAERESYLTGKGLTFTRKDGHFVMRTEREKLPYKIIRETETEIHLYKSGDSDGKAVTTFYALILLKKRKVLEETFTPEFNLVRVYAGSGSFSVGQPIHRDLQLNGKCVIG